jgi:hypothetical protein
MLFWIFFNKTWNYVIILKMFLVIQINTYLYSEVYIDHLCEFFVISNYDEMNCNIISTVFYKVF